jgi:hypothetical protein
MEHLSNQPVKTNNDFSFLGNPLLKPAGAEIELTQEQQFELVRCRKDPIYFIRTYVKIISLDEGVIPFRMWPFQEEFVKTINKHRFTIAKMPRQVGKTQTSASYILWCMLFKKAYTIAILGMKMEQAQEIMDRIQMSYENLPFWLQNGVVTWNKRSVELENGSKVFASATSGGAIRGKSVNLVYLDEFAHIERKLQQKFFTSTYPVISSGKNTKVIITSTPNGYEQFAKIWMDAEDGRNEYFAFPVHWSDVPGRDEAWKAQTIANTSEEQFRQEFEVEFIGSSSTLLSPTALALLRYDNPLRKTNNVKVFEEPIKGHKYIIGVDTSRGVGGDYSAFSVVDVTAFPYKVVATYRDNNVEPTTYPNFVDYASKVYNHAWIIVETNDIGAQIADILNMELENENILMVTQNGRKGQVLGGGFGQTKPRFGVKMSPAVKRIGCMALKALIENQQLLVVDYDIIQEFMTFVQEGTSYEAEYGKHDDMIMTLVLISWCTTQQYFKNLIENDVRQQILDHNQAMIDADMVPFGLYDDHGDGAAYEDEVWAEFDRLMWS